MRRKLFLGMSIAILLAGLMPYAVAQDIDQKMTFQVQQPIRIPGQTLQPGTYTIQILESGATKNVIEFSQDGETVATVFTVSARRMNPTDEPVFSFYETPAGQPEQLKAWFYPGRETGHRFVYEQQEAEQVASASSESVPVSETEQISPEGQKSQLTDEAIEHRASLRTDVSFEPEQETRQAQSQMQESSQQRSQAQATPATAQRTRTQQEQSETAMQQERQRQGQQSTLPDTAGSTPLMILLGAIALAGGWILRRLASVFG